MSTLLPAGSYAFEVGDTHEVNSFSSKLLIFIQKSGVYFLYLTLGEIEP